MDNKYVIFTDANSEMTAEMVAEMGVEVQPMRFTLNDKEYYNWPDGREMSTAEFYKQLRAGAKTATTQTNTIEFVERFRPFLQEGKDLMYIGFTSGLSGTFHAAEIAAEELMEEFPDRKVMIVDTLSASVGMIMLVKRASEMRAAGEPMEKAAKWIEDNRLNVVHWFTVDDLQFLKRGGRLSGAAALVGTMLSVKPILHVDEEGKLVVVDKVRGRKSSITRLVDEMEKKIIDSENQTIYIAHADCIDDAQLLADEIKKRTKIKDIVINFVGPVIGGHSGPNTLALIFFGKNRAVD